ncbi:hypothetical protein BGZ46_006845, partial [Entomortierella lignicola]
TILLVRRRSRARPSSYHRHQSLYLYPSQNNTIEGHSPLSPARILCYRTRYAFKDRNRLKQ